jgi:membrane protein
LFPGLAALVSIYGLVFDRAQLEQQMAAMAGLLPGQSHDLITGQLHQLVIAPSGALGIGFVVSVFIALWSAYARSNTAIQFTIWLLFRSGNV